MWTSAAAAVACVAGEYSTQGKCATSKFSRSIE